MSLAASFSWVVPAVAGGGSSGGGGSGGAPTRFSTGGLADPLGNGIVRPFRRTARADFATAAGAPLVMSDLGQLFGTPLGTLPWRHGFGADLQALRHKGNSPILAELARIKVGEAIKRWLSGVVDLKSVRVERAKSSPNSGAGPSQGKNVMILIATVVIGGKKEEIRVPV